PCPLYMGRVTCVPETAEVNRKCLEKILHLLHERNSRPERWRGAPKQMAPSEDQQLDGHTTARSC
ncbi:uncharacterized, partial [Tachysurus ichikawai]